MRKNSKTQYNLPWCIRPLKPGVQLGKTRKILTAARIFVFEELYSSHPVTEDNAY